MNVHPDSLGLQPRQRGVARGRAMRMPLMPSLRRRRLQCYLALMVVDVVVLFASFTLTGYLYTAEAGAAASLVLAQLLLPVFLTIACPSSKHLAQSWRRSNGERASSGVIF